MTATNTVKYFTEFDKTRKGHGRKIKAGLISTREAITQEETATKDDKETGIADTAAAMTMYDLQDNMTSTLYTDQTENFQVQLLRGYQYIMVLANGEKQYDHGGANE